jgi:capsid protein
VGWFPSLFRRQKPLAQLKREAVQRQFERSKASMAHARYDAAMTTSENREHWRWADGLSARSANSPGVRAIVRNRARYEAANNSYCAGMLLTLANDMIGTGPRLQMNLESRELCKFIEREFKAWSKQIKLPQKLRTMRVARGKDGEAFAVLTTNPRLRTPVKLDIHTVEADQVTTPYLNISDPLAIDGIRYDEFGNAIEYDILPRHPGDDIAVPNWVPVVHTAEQVIHWFRPDRPGQLRGISEILPALPLFAQLRRYTLAVIAAAETAANASGILETDASAADEDDPTPGSFTEIDIPRRSLITTPAGMKLSQLKAEQPVTTYGDFKHEIINEIARCLNMPYNVAAGNSAGYNYSSGRLDHQIYFRSIGIDQADCETDVLDRIFFAWLEEAQLIEGYLPERLEMPDYLVPHSWAWDPAEDLDPVKTAQAQLLRLQSGLTTYQREFAAAGFDWEAEQEDQAKSLGITLDQYRQLLVQRQFGAIVQPANESAMSARRVRRMIRRAVNSLIGGKA